MLDLLCPTCGKSLIIRYNETLNTFLSKVDYLKNDIPFIKETASKIEVGYYCGFCEGTFNFTFDEIFEKFLDRIVYDVKKYRKIHIFKNYINPHSINPDNGMIYCGACLGVDELGNCYNDIYLQCPVKGEFNGL